LQFEKTKKVITRAVGLEEIKRNYRTEKSEPGFFLNILFIEKKFPQSLFTLNAKNLLIAIKW
jgi:hypothetical protein